MGHGAGRGNQRAVISTTGVLGSTAPLNTSFAVSTTGVLDASVPLGTRGSSLTIGAVCWKTCVAAGGAMAVNAQATTLVDQR